MDGVTTVILLVAAAAMLTDWWAVRTDRGRVELVAKPLVMVALLGVAATADVEPATVRPWLLVALACGLLGDVFLLPQVDRFVAGLASFLVGHLCYVVAFLLMWDPDLRVVVGVAGLAGLVGLAGRPIVSALRESPLRGPVVAYIAVTGAIVLTASATGRWLALLGGLAFATSDGLLGQGRFVESAPQRRVAVHVLYHLGQALIVASAIWDA